MTRNLNALLTSCCIVALAGCAVQAGVQPTYNGPLTEDGQPNMAANYMPLPDGSVLRTWQSVRAADDQGLYQYGVVGTARTWPNRQTEITAQPMYNQSAGGFWASALVGTAQSAAYGIGGAALLARAAKPSNQEITVAGNNNGGTGIGTGGTGVATGGSSNAVGTGGAGGLSTAVSGASASVNSVISNHNVNQQSQFQQQQQHQHQNQGVLVITPHLD